MPEAPRPRTRQLTARLRRRGAPPDARPRSEALTERVVADMAAAIPAYRNATPEFGEVVRLVVTRIVDQVIALWLEQRLATRHEINDLVAVCVPPTDQGITLEDQLRVFHIAQDVMWWELHRMTDERELAEPEMALELSHLGVELLTELSRGVTSEYLRGDRVWLQRRDAERALIRGLLDAPPRIEEATRAAHALDLRLFETWQSAVYEPLDLDGDRDELARVVEAGRVQLGSRGAIAIDGDVVVMVTHDELPPAPDGARVGVGRRLPGTQGLRTSHDEAREALTIARRRGVTHVDADEARLDRVFLGSMSPTELADVVLLPLADELPARREMLLETLEVWLDQQGGATAVARQLSLHPQSARYRIDQLRGLFGDALDDPRQRLQLHLAIKALAFSSDA